LAAPGPGAAGPNAAELTGKACLSAAASFADPPVIVSIAGPTAMATSEGTN